MNTDLDRVLAWSLDHPWAITRPMLSVVAHILGRRLLGTAAADDPAPTLAALRPERATAPSAPSSVAVLPLHGVLAPRMNLLSNISGGATFEEAGAQLAKLVADPSVSTVVLDVDSPGGSVAGATEFAQQLLRARTQKRIIAVANHTMASAAYWAGACASEVVATPSALVGSVGVYCMHEDLSAYLQKEGIALTYVSAGKYKTDGNPSEPLTETAHARLQLMVDAAMTAFATDVAAGRGISPEAVRTGYGEGATLTAGEALRAGLIDRIETLDAVVARAVSLPPLPARRALAASDYSLGRELAAIGL